MPITIRWQEYLRKRNIQLHWLDAMNNKDNENKNNHHCMLSIYRRHYTSPEKWVGTYVSRKNGGECYIQCFNGRGHLVVMFYAVIMRFDSLLAETCKPAHLDITFKIGRSTLVDANKRCPEAVFETLYRNLYATFRRVLSSDNRSAPWTIALWLRGLGCL